MIRGALSTERSRLSNESTTIMPSNLVDTSLLLQTACNYLDNGIGVAPCSFKKHGINVPVIGWKALQKERLTHDAMRDLFKRFEQDITGICVFSGQVSNGLVVRDFDDMETYHEWHENYGREYPKLPRLKTNRGMHVYFNTEESYLMYEGKIHGEYRGTSKQYGIIAPSIHHKTKQPYKWVVPPKNWKFPFVSNPIKAGLLYEWVYQKHRHCGKVKIRPEIPKSNTKTTPNLKTIASHAETVSASFLTIFHDIENKARIHQPKRIGERNAKILAYVQSIKGIQKEWMPYQLETAFNVWWINAKDIVGTKCEIVSRNDFQKAFANCNFPKQSKLDIQRLIESSQEQTIPECILHCGDKVKLLAKVCKTLQQCNWPESFYLSSLDAGKLLNVSQQRAWSMLKLLTSKGLLLPISTGKYNSGEASEYRWN